MSRPVSLQRMARLWLLIASALVASAVAASPAMDSPVESIAPLQALLLAHMQGEVDIGADGRVTAARLVTVAPDDLRAGVEREMLAWRFAPSRLDGVAVPVRSRVSLTLGAPPVPTVTRVWIDDATFSGGDGGDPVDLRVARVTVRKRVSPRYPTGLGLAGVPGRVVVAMRVGMDGRVEDAAVTSSSLREIRARKAVLDDALGQLEAASLKAARLWRFDVEPRAGVAPRAGDMTVHVPFAFSLGPVTQPKDGQFRLYVRTPRRTAPWLDPTAAPFGMTVDAGGEVKRPESGPTLLTPLGDGKDP